MKVNKCDTLYFQGKTVPEEVKKKFINKTMRSDARELLAKMNQGTKYYVNEAGTGFTSDILASVNLGSKIKFTDERYLLHEIKDPKKAPGFCSLQIGKNFLQMDSETGEILKYKKGIFKPWKTFLSQAGGYIKDLLINFDNKEIVQKNFFGISGFTKKGFEQMKKAQNDIYYNRK